MNLLQDLRAAMPQGMTRPIGVRPEGMTQHPSDGARWVRVTNLRGVAAIKRTLFLIARRGLLTGIPCRELGACHYCVFWVTSCGILGLMLAIAARRPMVARLDIISLFGE
jgi:hypothetical protein